MLIYLILSSCLLFCFQQGGSPPRMIESDDEFSPRYSPVSPAYSCQSIPTPSGSPPLNSSKTRADRQRRSAASPTYSCASVPTPLPPPEPSKKRTEKPRRRRSLLRSCSEVHDRIYFSHLKVKECYSRVNFHVLGYCQ